MLVEFIIEYSKMKMDDFDLIKKLLNAKISLTKHLCDQIILVMYNTLSV